MSLSVVSVHCSFVCEYEYLLNLSHFILEFSSAKIATSGFSKPELVTMIFFHFEGVEMPGHRWLYLPPFWYAVSC
jgi:hypothetical protein